MKPYVNRLRLRIAQLDLPKKRQRLKDARRKMTNLLTKQKVRKKATKQVVAQALDIAADHQLELLRRDQAFQELKHSTRR